MAPPLRPLLSTAEVPVLSLSTLACAERSRGAQDRLSRGMRGGVIHHLVGNGGVESPGQFKIS